MEVRRLTPHTGVEVLGLDLRISLSDAIQSEVQNLLAKRSVIVFREQKLSPPEFMQAARTFGEIMPQMLERFTLPEHPLVGFVSSEDTDKPGGKRMIRGEQYHTDHSNFDAPPKATLLHAVELPGSGGDTQFVNAHAGYEDLADEVKARIASLRVLSCWWSCSSPFWTFDFRLWTFDSRRQPQIPPNPPLVGSNYLSCDELLNHAR